MKKQKPERKEFIGNRFFLAVWILLFFPVAIMYWAMNREYPSKIKYA